ncbi:MAG: hypothetical protein ACMUIS_08600 [bacterium]
MIGAGLCMFMTLVSYTTAYALTGSVDYLWEQKRREDRRTSEFTQTYDLILSRRLQPLYEASLRFEFMSQTREGMADRKQTQWLPSMNMRLGNEMMNLNLGWSEDTITEEQDVALGTKETTYTNERTYAGLNWRPRFLPQVLLQIEEQRRDQPGKTEPVARNSRISLREDYAIRIGLVTLSHTFNQEREDTGYEVDTTYDLLNTGRIRNTFSLFNKRVNMGTGYELSQGKEKEEDGIHKDMWRHNAHFTMSASPVEWMMPEYRVFWGEIDSDFPEKPDTRETSMTHDLSIFLNPNPYLPSTLGMNYSRNEQSEVPGPRELTTYSMKLEPSIKGLIVDPNSSLYPINTSILMSSSTDASMGIRQTHTRSVLFTGAGRIHQGMDLDVDLGYIQRENFVSNSRRYEERIDAQLNMNLLPSLKAVLKQRAEWIEDNGGSAYEHYFTGSVDTRCIYRPVQTFFLDAGYTVYYEGEGTSYQCTLSWRPTSKIEIDTRYQSGSRDRTEYFSGELNITATDTIRFDVRYQSPSEDQLMKAQFTIRF